MPDTTSLQHAVHALQQGCPILLTDDVTRENEADVVFPAQFVTADKINFMLNHCSGIICLCLTSNDTKHLKLPLMVPINQNNSRYQTAFTLSIEAKEGVSTGVSSHDRAHTIKTAVRDGACAEDLVRPGHIFPLQASNGGVLKRPGHTEGAIDLMRFSGLKPTAVLCELMNPDGTMAQSSQIHQFAKEHGLCIISIEQIIKHRQQNRSFVV